MGNSTPIPSSEPPNGSLPGIPKKWNLWVNKDQVAMPWAWIIIPWIFLAVLGTLYFSGKLGLKTSEDKESILITRIESMGKLELVKYHLKDIVEHKIIRTWFPDPSALLIIGGEAVGCIDLTQIQKKNILIRGDSLSIKLPPPEICYIKINHNESKVYSTQFAFWDEAKLVDEAYRDAEKQLGNTVAKSDILQQTKTNAKLVLTPLFLSLGFKSVEITY